MCRAIFGDGTKAVQDFASKGAVALGQSKQQMLDASATFGTFGKAAVGACSVAAMSAAPPIANWYPDPTVEGQLRYWDGSQWTEHVHPMSAAPRSGSRVVASVAAGAGASMGRWARAKASRHARPVASHEPQKSMTVADVIAEMTLEEPRHPLDEQIEVVGETYNVKGIKRVFRDEGMPISAQGSTLDDLTCVLVPEPWNPHDRNAVAVAVGMHQVGYLPADIAMEYSSGLVELAQARRLATGTARIWALSDGGVVRARVTILVPEADRF